jgi:hypothetical protein
MQWVWQTVANRENGSKSASLWLHVTMAADHWPTVRLLWLGVHPPSASSCWLVDSLEGPAASSGPDIFSHPIGM